MDEELAVGTIVQTRDGRRARVTGYDEQKNVLIEYLPEQDLRPSATPVATSDAEAAGNGLAGFGRTALQGLTLALSDEARGVLTGLARAPGAGTFREGYREGVEAEREALQAYRESNPIAALAAETLGGMATGAGGVRLATKVPRLARMLGAQRGMTPAQSIRAAQVSQTGGGALGQAATAAKVGAAEGAIYGLGAGEDTAGQRLTGAAVGGLVGGVAAPVMSGLVTAAGKGAGLVQDIARGQRGKSGIASRQLKVDEEMAKSLMREAPSRFAEQGSRWLQTARRAVDDVESNGSALEQGTGRTYTPKEIEAFRKGLLDYEESGNSPVVSGLLGAASDALRREAQPSANPPRLLADITEDYSETAAMVTRQKGDDVDELRERIQSGSRARQAEASLQDLSDAAGLDRQIGGVRARQAAIEAEKENVAQKDYNAFYEAVDDWDNILSDAGTADRPGLVQIMSNLRSVLAERDPLRSQLNRLQGPETSSGLLQGSVPNEASENLAQILKNAFTDVDVADAARRVIPQADDVATGRALGFDEIVADVTNASPADFDRFRRALKTAQEKAHLEGNSALRDNIGSIVRGIDDAIAANSDKFANARRGYQSNLRRLEAYEDGARLSNVTPEDLRYLHDNPWSIRRGASSISGLSPEQLNDIRKAFREGYLNSIADKAAAKGSDLEGANYLFEQFQVLFEGSNAPFARHAEAVSDEVLARVRGNMESRARLARTNQRIENKATQGTSLEKSVAAVEEAVPATAGLYGLADQYGAMARTGVMAMIYGRGAEAKYAQNLARRLRQKESRGLLDMAENVKNIERDRVRGLVRKQDLTSASGLLMQPLAADVSADLQGERRYR